MTLARQLTVRSARALWPLIKSLNTTFERPAKTPSWAPSPLLKSRQKSFPTLGWPRETDSLCPACVKEVRGDILSGRRQLSEDKDAVVIRQAGLPDRRVPKADIRSTKFIRRSLMPEGLLDALQDQQVADLLAYLTTLKG